MTREHPAFACAHTPHRHAPQCGVLPEVGVSPWLQRCVLDAGHEGDEHENLYGVRFTVRKVRRVVPERRGPSW